MSKQGPTFLILQYVEPSSLVGEFRYGHFEINVQTEINVRKRLAEAPTEATGWSSVPDRPPPPMKTSRICVYLRNLFRCWVDSPPQSTLRWRPWLKQAAQYTKGQRTGVLCSILVDDLALSRISWMNVLGLVFIKKSDIQYSWWI